MGKSIGEMIREMRKAAGMSQSALAERLGLSYQQVQKYEKGGGITVSRLIQIAEAFGVPVSVFLDAAEVNQARPDCVPLSEDEFKLLMLYRGLARKKVKNGFIEILEGVRETVKKYK